MSGTVFARRIAIVCPQSVDTAQRYVDGAHANGAEPLIITTPGSGQYESLRKRFHTELIGTLDTEGASLRDCLLRFDDLAGLAAAGEFAVVPTEHAASALGLRRAMRGDPNVLRNKAAMRAAFDRAGVHQPNVFGVANDIEAVSSLAASICRYPVISKPVELAGSWYVSLNQNAEEILANARPIFDYPRSLQTGLPLATHCLIEQYVEGPEYSAEAVVLDGRVLQVFITRKITSPPPHFDEVGHVSGLPIGPVRRARIEEVVQRVATAALIDSAVLHVEFRLTELGPCVIEAGARVGGDQISKLVELQHGVSLEGALVALRLGNFPEPSRPLTDEVTGIRFCFPDFQLPSISGERVLGQGELNPGVKMQDGLSPTHLQNRRGFQIFRASAAAVRDTLGFAEATSDHAFASR